MARYSAGYRSRGESHKLKFLISVFFKNALILGAVTFLIVYLLSPWVLLKLKITSPVSPASLGGLFASAWLMPVVTGSLQGLELFAWLNAFTIFGSTIKLALAALLITLGFGVNGAIAAFTVASVAGLALFWWPLKANITLGRMKKGLINLREIFVYLLPVALSSFCFIALVSLDMVMVKYFFTPDEAGSYALAQMLGKIFLFLPSAISVVLLPRASGLSASNQDSFPTLKRSLLYAGILCVAASVFYNLFPAFVLKILTGKALPLSITLGRFFSFSMTFFALTYVMITYFVSIGDWRFLKIITVSIILQFILLALNHASLIQVQTIICANSILLFTACLWMARRPKK
jgi:O-antigen/teichoic acid export membrane protein